MPKYQALTVKTLNGVINRLGAYLDDMEKEGRAAFIKPFDEFLDELLDEDFFGTEGQCDPRGDHRD